MKWTEEGYSTKKYGIDAILPVEGEFDERYVVALRDQPDGTREMLILALGGQEMASAEIAWDSAAKPPSMREGADG